VTNAKKTDDEDDKIKAIAQKNIQMMFDPEE
jgi:hypothetical protein